MSCLNFLYKVRNGKSPDADPSISARIFVNFWKLPVKEHWYNSKKYRRWLDIGVIVEGVSDNIEEIAICLPFKIGKEDIKDLSEYVKNEKFVSHIMKKRYRLLSLPDTPAYYRLQSLDNQVEVRPLYLYEICDNSKDIKDLKDGSKFTVKMLSHPKDSKEIKESPDEKSTAKKTYDLYFQFRIIGLSDKNLSHNEVISNDFIQSAFAKSEMVDIIFNDITNIDHSDHQQITQEHELLQLSKVDFAFIGSSEDETVNGNLPLADCELLDNELWKEYMEGIETDGKKCIAYHWKVEKEPWKVFFKTVYSARNWKRILKYALVVILLSFLASCMLEGIKHVYHYIDELRQENSAPKTQPLSSNNH
ncbi:MAG: hypothetical protein K2N48_12630 [Muribaculaceae bacterium]|nr:hypothetical protein [Muribaculaceae bacterium]